jgi:hypothetical protein
MFQDYRVVYSEKGYAHRIGAVLTRIHCYCWITIKSYCPDFAIFRFVIFQLRPTEPVDILGFIAGQNYYVKTVSHANGPEHEEEYRTLNVRNI